MLILEVEYLLGVAFAARADDPGRPEWPPAADRVFSALVAAWGSRGNAPAERAALEWLERQPPPIVDASGAQARTAPAVFVPPNDLRSSSMGVLPTARQRQERRFPAVAPENTLVNFSWPDEPDGETLARLDAIARDVVYVGHSTSLTRCRFATGAKLGRIVDRWVYPGRLEYLERRFRAGKHPDRRGDLVAPVKGVRQGAPPARSVFGNDWIVLASSGLVTDTDEPAPDIRAVGLVAKAVRDRLVEKYTAQGAAAPEWVSGKSTAGKPSTAPHLAIVPLANIGWSYSDGTLMGMALVPTREGGNFDALVELLRETMAPGTDRPVLELQLSSELIWRLTPSDESVRSSLQRGRWCGTSTRWATATPIALDRYPKASDPRQRQAEHVEVIARACEAIGLPRPALIIPNKHSAVTGSPSAWPSARAPQSTAWRLTPALTGRPLIHAVLEFETPVRGPMLIGAGRYHGLGMCLPLEDQPGA